jgi:hypothetical protein
MTVDDIRLMGRWRRLKKAGLLSDKWMDFREFKRALGASLLGKRLVAVDKTKPIGPDNYEIVSRSTKADVVFPKTFIRKIAKANGSERRIILRDARKRGATLRQLGEILGLSRERIRQLVSTTYRAKGV